MTKNEDFIKPNAVAIKESCNDVAPDCFDCGMKVTNVTVSGDAPPYQVLFEIRFFPYHESPDEVVEESFALQVDDPNFDVDSAAIEMMGEVLGDYME